MRDTFTMKNYGHRAKSWGLSGKKISKLKGGRPESASLQGMIFTIVLGNLFSNVNSYSTSPLFILFILLYYVRVLQQWCILAYPYNVEACIKQGMSCG